ncbi:MAG TPA: helix-turn-helix domain-containing protein [Acidimicrobiales bacterium]|nr:helix-turn-helix domain-containing protein [Acidimicrobiales bacterium]
MSASTGSPPPRRRGRPPARRREETYDRILRAARVCFSRGGFANTSMTDIATAADVTARALYHYVDSKPELFAAAAERAYERFMLALDAQVFVYDDALSRLHGYVDMYRTLYKEDPSLVAFVSLAVLEASRTPGLRITVPAGVLTSGGAHEAIVADAVEAGQLGPGIDAAGAKALLDVFGSGLTLMAHPDRDAEYLAMLDAFEHMLDGPLVLGATAPPAAPPPPGGGPAR